MAKSGFFDDTERIYSADEQMWQGHEFLQSRIHTALPIIAEKHDPKTNTVDGNSAVQLAELQPGGGVKWKPIPKLTMPTLHLGGGGMAITIPVQKDDEGLAIFASRSIDNWWSRGGQQSQPSNRMHDLSDGFFIPGFRSQPKALPDVSADSFQIRTQDGKTNMNFNPSGGGTFSFATPQNPLSVSGKAFDTNVKSSTQKATDKITLDTPLTQMTRDAKVNGKIDATGGFFQNGVPITGGGGGGGGNGGGITSITLTGDVSGGGGEVVDTTVIALQNVPLAYLTPVAGQVLGFNGTQWLPTDPLGSPGSTGNVIISDTPPTATAGALWWDSYNGHLYVRYFDGDTTQWVTTSSAGPQGPPGTGSGGGGDGGGIPEAPVDGVAYGRRNAAWVDVLMATGDIVDGGNY